MNFKLFKEILTEKDKSGNISYSQGRVYLLWSVIAYYISLAIVTIKALNPSININLEPIKEIIDALQWALLLFATYAFGGKGLDTIKTVLSKTGSTDKPIEPTVQSTDEKI